MLGIDVSGWQKTISWKVDRRCRDRVRVHQGDRGNGLRQLGLRTAPEGCAAPRHPGRRLPLRQARRRRRARGRGRPLPRGRPAASGRAPARSRPGDRRPSPERDRALGEAVAAPRGEAHRAAADPVHVLELLDLSGRERDRLRAVPALARQLRQGRRQCPPGAHRRELAEHRDPPVHLEGPHCRLERSRRPEPAEERLDARQAHARRRAASQPRLRAALAARGEEGGPARGALS